jgi:outer membrane protein assembly factor BamA
MAMEAFRLKFMNVMFIARLRKFFANEPGPNSTHAPQKGSAASLFSSLAGLGQTDHFIHKKLNVAAYICVTQSGASKRVTAFFGNFHGPQNRYIRPLQERACDRA